MSLMKKLVVGAALTATMMSAALASPITVDGVTWDPDAGNDFFALGGIMHQDIATSGPNKGEVSGYGLVTAINSSPTINDFCNGCQLTYQFSGFKPVVADTLPTSVGQVIGYTGGVINVYRHAPTILNINAAESLTSANTGLNGGSLWLQLTGHNYLGASFFGTVLGNPFTNQITGLSGIGQLDAVGGSAFGNFNTNGSTDGADLGMVSGFSSLVVPGNPNSANGNGNFSGNTIPEPGSLALLGLGLLGAAVARRRQA